jgi:hypothetical protein
MRLSILALVFVSLFLVVACSKSKESASGDSARVLRDCINKTGDVAESDCKQAAQAEFDRAAAKAAEYRDKGKNVLGPCTKMKKAGALLDDGLKKAEGLCAELLIAKAATEAMEAVKKLGTTSNVPSACNRFKSLYDATKVHTEWTKAKGAEVLAACKLQ